MSLPTSGESDPLLTRQDHRQLSCYCKLSYKPRKFSSKGAVLVLVWQFLVFCGVYFAYIPLRQSFASSLLGVGLVLVVLVAIISGWLADTKVGRSRVVQTGLFLTWLGVVLETVFSTLIWSVHTTSKVDTLVALQHVALYTAYGGAALFFPNILQFGLEQMPDASSDAMSAFISWMLIVTFLGEGSFGLAVALKCCIYDLSLLDNNTHTPVIACALLSVAMCSKFLFSHWLIDHRQNHHPLKTVYRVLKFAKQHKCPVNRSAFTYCEDEIPSRIDFGKSKYGGPFTTEEVEDVKTFFRVLLVISVIFAILITIVLQKAVPFPSIEQSCLTCLLANFSGFFTAAVFLTYEYIVYPCIKICYRLTMLKQIGVCMLLWVLISISQFMLAVVDSVDVISIITIVHLNNIVVNWLANVVLGIFFYSTFQFICAQAPEHMKSFFLVWPWLAVVAIFLLYNNYYHTISIPKCFYHKLKYCGVYLTSVAIAFSLLVFVVYCCVARWYKRRERDEPCNERARIEEIYGRHVEHNSIEEQDTD